MKKLAIVAGVVYPDPSPTGNCALQFARMLKDEFDVSIVFIQMGLEQVNGKTVDGIHYYSVFGLRVFLENFFAYGASRLRGSLGKRLCQIVVRLLKGIGRIQSVFLFPDNLRWYYRASYRKLQSLERERGLDAVLTICSPMSAHMAGRVFKSDRGDKVKWITYTVDPFVRAMEANRKRFAKSVWGKISLRVEGEVYSQADFNLVSDEVYGMNGPSLVRVLNKTRALPYVLSRPVGIRGDYFPADKINLLYAGRFYRNLRSPEYLFTVFLLMANPDVVLHLYSASDCEETIEEYVSRSSGRIVRHAQVSSREIGNVLLSADILVNVGNLAPEFKPSKVAQYVSTGKPIVSFSENGQTDDMLDRYPLSLQFEKGRAGIEVDAASLEEFVLRYRRYSLEWESVERIFPRHTYGAVRSILLEALTQQDTGTKVAEDVRN